MQYALGAYLAQWVNNNGFLITNPSLFLKGMDDAFQNKPRMIPDSLLAPLVAYYQRTGQKEKAVKQEQLLFAALRDKPGVGVLPNGVRYIVLKTGKGAHAGEQDSVSLHILAKLADGMTVVENTFQTGKPIVTTPAGLFPGLYDPLQMMAEGAKWQLFIPAVLAYGEKGTALIPANSALILEVELLSVKRK